MDWKTILVPTDFSDAADKAYAQTLRLADDGAEIHLLHRLPSLIPMFSLEDQPSGSFSEMGRMLDEYMVRTRADAQERLDALAAKALPDVSVHVALEESLEPDKAILAKAESLDVDLIALGTHGRRGLDKLVMGSVANKVLHHASRNVMLVRADSELREPSTILVPVDFSDYAHRALRVARSLAERAGGAIHVLHVIEIERTPLRPGALSSPLEDEPELREKSEEALRDMLGSSRGDITVAEGISVAGATLQHREAIGADFVVMGSRGHTGLKHALLGSVAETVARYCEVPVIVVK